MGEFSQPLLLDCHAAALRLKKSRRLSDDAALVVCWTLVRGEVWRLAEPRHVEECRRAGLDLSDRVALRAAAGFDVKKKAKRKTKRSNA